MIESARKIDLKVLAAPRAGAGASRLELTRAIPVFHRWIQERALDELMVDVADYTHVPDGPGVVLVCHDAIYALDSGGGGLGLLYSRRRETHPALGTIASLDDRLVSVFARALAACALLEREEAFGGALRFLGDRFTISVNDRRVAGAADAAALGGALERLAGRLFPGEASRIEPGGAEAGERISATLRCDRAPGVAALRARLEPQLARTSS